MTPSKRSAPLALAACLVLLPTAASARDGGTLEPSRWEVQGAAAFTGGTLTVPPGSSAATIDALGTPGFEMVLQYAGEGIAVVTYAFRDGDGYRVIFHGDGTVQLEQASGGTLTSLGWTEQPVTGEGTPFALSVAATSSGHTVVIDGQAVLTTADPTAIDGAGIAVSADGARTVTVQSFAAQGGGAAPPPGEGTPPPEEGAPPPDEGTAGPAATATTVAATEAAASQSWLDEFFGLTGTSIATGDAIVNLGLAALLSFVLSRVYVLWGSGLSNRRRFAGNFMLVTVTTTFIILVVRSSVALSLGLVGALSIVRFRAAIKDPEELAYMFMAIAIGIGLGDDQRLITILSLGVAIVIIGLLKVFRRREADFNLHVTVASRGAGVDLAAVTAVLRDHTTRLQLSRYDETPEGVEAAFLAEFRDAAGLHAAREALVRTVPGAGLTFLDNRGLA